MICNTSCIIAGAFIFSSVFLAFRVNKQTLNDPLFQLLSQTNKDRYMLLANERRNIYLKGFLLGFLLSLLGLFIIHKTKIYKTNKISNICFITATSFIVNYFFYILHPKSDYMIRHLKSTKEKEAWLHIYRTMQFNCHLGFVLGLIGMMFVGNSFC